MASGPARVFSIPPGAPFLATFVEAFLADGIVAGVAGDPARLAGATIFVPTRRSAQALAVEFARAVEQTVVLLPKIVPLGRLEEVETELAFQAGGSFDGPSASVPDAIDDMERRLVLTRMILEWARSLRHAIVSIDERGEPRFIEGEPLLVATSPAQAWQLSGDLAALVDDMIIEGVAWDALTKLAPDAFDDYWRITLEFLKIAMSQWPAHLAGRGLVDGAERRRRLVDLEIARLSAGGGGPVVAIGSTGANPATARLLGAIARRENGAIVLPGVDLDLDAAAWALIAGDAARAIDPANGHPQAMLQRLLATIGVARADVVELGERPAEQRHRARLVAEAMRPADATDGWLDFARAEGARVAGALAGVTLIEAADEREEALCLAIQARKLLERPGATGALVTPDRALALRVKGELARWNIDVEDTGGESLALSPAGVLARLTLAAADGGRAIDLVALLAHPLARLGMEPDDLRDLARLLEIGVWRAVPVAGLSPATAISLARENVDGPDAHPAARAMTADDWTRCEALLTELDATLAPLAALASAATLPAWTDAHRAAMARLMAPLEPGEESAAIDGLLGSLAASRLADISFASADYAALFEQILAEKIVRQPRRAHPRFKILGPLEARLLHADVFLLGGLDETIWPPAPGSDPFLNRPMRAALGLGAPERRIGQTAHDFSQFLGAPEVVISRARKRGGAPTVPSRFLQRLAALAGEAAWNETRARGARAIALSRLIDAGTPRKIPRPAPCPPLDLRPTSLSVTRIETLRRDPYGIHAERILKLKPMGPVGPEAGAREIGEFLHDLIAGLARAHPSGRLPANALDALRAAAEKSFATLRENPEFRAFQWPRVETALAAIVEWENARRDDIAEIIVEQGGALPLALSDGTIFKLTARADRIERRRDGSIVILDFKSGRTPTKKEVAAGFAPQLTLEAAMIERDAFASIPRAHVADALYVKMLGVDEIKPLSIASKDNPLPQLVADHFVELRGLLDQFRDAGMAYPPRPYAQFINEYGDYDHLARVKEWSSGDGGGGET